ncbi:hypothetical protein [Streptomyces reniochalinae]
MALALSWRSAWRAVMLEETLSERDLERTDALISAWANGLGRLAEFIHENPAERDMRLVTVQHMLEDLTLDIAQACLHAELSPAQALQHIGPENVVNFFWAAFSRPSNGDNPSPSSQSFGLLGEP